MNCIASIGYNKAGSNQATFNLVDMAIKSGCKAIKIQKHSVEDYFVKPYLSSNFTHYQDQGSTVGEIYNNIEFSFEQITELREYCRGKIEFWYAPFDSKSFSFQKEIGADRIYISSPIIPNIDLIQQIVSSEPALAISVQVADARESEWASELIDKNGNKGAIFLYHLRGVDPLEKYHYLKMLAHSTNKYRKVGFEETDKSILMMAALIGARYFEFPISFSNSTVGFAGPEDALSPNKLKEVVVELKQIMQELESDSVPHLKAGDLKEKDRETLSIVAKFNLEPGTVIEKEMLALKAPYRGLSPGMLNKIVGSKILYPIKKDDFITFGLIDIQSSQIIK